MRTLLAVVLVALLPAAVYSQPQSSPPPQVDEKVTATLLLKAQGGDAEAQYALGALYAIGQGVPQDFPRALEWTRKAADQGHREAQFNLAVLIGSGKGVEANERESVEWLTKAGNQGHSEAQFLLGRIYAAGRVGILNDDASAVGWFSKAAAQGHAEALKALSEMALRKQAPQAAGWSRVVVWKPGAEPESQEHWLSGFQVRGVVTPRFSVYAFVESTGDPIRVWVSIGNKSDDRFDVIPSGFTLSVVEPQAKSLEYVTPQAVAKKIETAAAWAMAAEAIASGMRAYAGASTYTSGTAMAFNSKGGSAWGTYNGVVTNYDNTANQALTNTNMAAISNYTEAEKLRQTTGALLPNTVFPGQDYAGVAHFKRDKKATLLLLRVPLANSVVEIPLVVPKR